MAVWPPSAPPIAHGLPGSSGPGVEAVVRALAVGDADRVDGRQVDDVETHRRDRRQAGGGGAQRARLVRRGALGAREELVPGGEGAELAVDPQRERARQRRRRAVDGAPHQRHRRRPLGGRRPARPAPSRPRSALARADRARRVGGADPAARGALVGHAARPPRAPGPRPGRRRSAGAGRAARSRSRRARAMTSKLHGPAFVGTKLAWYTVVARGSQRQLAPARRRLRATPVPAVVRGGPCRTQASRRSWPSAMTVALTCSGRPTAALAGWAPPSTAGRTSSISTRPTDAGTPVLPVTSARRRPAYRACPARRRGAARLSVARRAQEPARKTMIEAGLGPLAADCLGGMDGGRALLVRRDGRRRRRPGPIPAAAIWHVPPLLLSGRRFVEPNVAPRYQLWVRHRTESGTAASPRRSRATSAARSRRSPRTVTPCRAIAGH